jgi:hypothetical protein
MQRYDFEVRRGDETIAFQRSIELQTPRALWLRVAELAESVPTPGGRIRVTDQSGDIVILTGIVAARLVAASMT